MPNIIEQLHARAKAEPKRVVFPEPQDPRVIEAATEFQRLGLGNAILLGSLESELEVATLDNEELLSRCADQLAENRKHRGMTSETAREAIAEDPLLCAALLVRTGFADASVAGSVATTASVIRAGLYGVGPRAGRKLISSFFLMQLANRALTYADCGVVPDPDAEQLGEIAVTAAENHALLTGETPRVAMLSFSTKGSAHHARVDKVREALEFAKRLAPELAIDGELQFDAAFVPAVAQRKAPSSSVAGQANVFIFPDLDAGNIAYKITERLAGARALGPLVQGLAKPCMDLSRGCSPRDIVDVAVVASVLAQNSADLENC